MRCGHRSNSTRYENMHNAWFDHFSQWIALHTGLKIQQRDRKRLAKALQRRLQSLKLQTLQEYTDRLAHEPADGPEWQKLAQQLTICESYFFRDKGQFRLLRNTILPDLVAQQKKRRVLRLWSAGCATGEEAYSLAILIEEILGPGHDWNVMILGTDISATAIDKARNGFYPQWSFRMVPSSVKQRYFQQSKGGWQLNENLRHKVTWRVSNLLESFPSVQTGIFDMDLIVCRNVLIYFVAEAIPGVIANFSASLRRRGYLMLGHNEMPPLQLSGLKHRIFPESVIYQSCQDEPPVRTPTEATSQVCCTPVPAAVHPLPEKPAVANTVSRDTVADALAEAQRLFRSKQYARALAKANLALQINHRDCEVLYLIACIFANQRVYERARDYCRQILQLDAFAVRPYLLLAQIAEEQDDIESAKTLLKK